MGHYTVITASKEQAQALYEKHMKPMVLIPRITKVSYTYDSEDGIGFVTLNTITGKRIEYQLRGDEPIFVGFTGFGDIRYDVHYPWQIHEDMYKLLKEYGAKAKNTFWKGGEI
jgi:hypothetical protein